MKTIKQLLEGKGFEPHMMYHPETGEGVKAEKPEDHERLKKKGYTHEKPEVGLDEAFQQFLDKSSSNWGEEKVIAYGRKKGHKEVGVCGTGKVDGIVLFDLDAGDKKYVGKEAKVKTGQTVFRYATRNSMAGDIFPLIKIDVKRGLMYHLTQASSSGDVDYAEFESRSVKLRYLRFASTANLRDVVGFDPGFGTMKESVEDISEDKSLEFRKAKRPNSYLIYKDGKYMGELIKSGSKWRADYDNKTVVHRSGLVGGSDFKTLGAIKKQITKMAGIKEDVAEGSKMTWKQTNSMTAAQAIKKYGKKNVKVKKGGLRSGEDYIQVLVPEEKEDMVEGLKMNDPKLLKIFDKLKRGSTVKIKHDSVLEKGKDFIEYVVKSKNTVRRGEVEKITLAMKGNPTGAKRYLYKKDGKVTMAMGDMAVSPVDIKEDFDLDYFLENARAKRDAMRAIGKRGKDSADEDEFVASDDDRKAASKNVLMQIRKLADLPKGGEIEFESGKKAKISQDDAKKVAKLFNTLKKPQDKVKFQKVISKDLKTIQGLLKRLGR